MRNSEIEKRIESAIECAAPDQLDEIFKICGIENEAVNRKKEYVPAKRTWETRKKKWAKMGAGLAAVFVLCFASLFLIGEKSGSAAAIIGLDVNPSIEISVDLKGKVLEVNSINSDGETILDGMDLEGTDIDVASNAIIGSMLKNGYLNEITNSILVSVQSDDVNFGKEMEERISKNINEYLESCAIGGAILGQMVEDDAEIATFAEENKISRGKATLIKSLVHRDKRIDEYSLLKLSTQELLLIASDREGDSNEILKYGTVNSSQYIDKDKALAIVLEKAGVQKKDISNVVVAYECDDGNMIYDVEFYSGMLKFEGEVDATLGKLLEYEVEGTDKLNADEIDASYISYEKAKEIALSKAGINAADAYDYESELENGIYEIEFEYMNMEFEVDIDAASGAVRKFEKEYDD